MSKDSSTSCKTILAGTIAKGLLGEVNEGLEKLASKPHPAARTYADWTGKTCKDKYDC